MTTPKEDSEKKNVAVSPQNELARVFNAPLNIDPVNDSYTIKGGAGLAVAHVKKPSGEVFSMRVRANGALQEMVKFDPSLVTVEERRRLEMELYGNGHTQNEIADLVGVKQPTVAHDLKLMRAKNKAAE
jgi:DNA-binding CsgD family transcriptional regulator